MAVEKVSNKSRLSRDLIKTTMKRLVAETNANSVITVTTLVREANINRATFYYHYESLEQVYLDILNDFIENAEQLVKSYGKNLTGAILAHPIVEWLEENEAFCRSFIRRYPLFAYSDVRKVLGNWAFRMSCHLFGYDVEPPPSVLLFVSGLI
ncbi:MAG: TetR/AcrR family transcriptional regulator, partial [Bacilli bacterium]|nr:TetR/AcrR family transcriptional regulator [Bacilli bacterium]